MEEKIKEVYKYFKEKIIKGDYKLIKTDLHIASITIDDKYEFALWIPNGENNFSIYTEFNHNSFMRIDFTAKDKKEAWKNYKEKDTESDEGQKKAIRDEIEKLEDRLKSL